MSDIQNSINSNDVSVAVVVPMYNEALGAKRCIETICNVLSKIDTPCTLVVVNDGSKDETQRIVEPLVPIFSNLKFLQHPVNKGYGAALRSGIEYAINNRFKYVLFMDSDLTNDPRDIPLFIEQMKKDVDVIKATRYSRGGRVSGVPLFRVVISRVGNIVGKLLFRVPIFDVTNGFRAAKCSVLRQFQLSENNFSIIMEELYYERSLGCVLSEVPVKLTDRAADLRGTSFRYRPAIFYDYLKYPLRSFFDLFTGKSAQKLAGSSR